MRELPKPVPVSEALRETSIDINVPEGATMVAGPFERQHFDAFRVAEVTSFKDLQVLGFVPQQVSEEQLTRAIRQDDREHAAWLHRTRTASSSHCTCEGSQRRSEAAPARRYFHNNLVEVLQPLFRGALTADDPAVKHTYHHARTFLSASRLAIGLFRLRDINIADNATLTMTPTVQALYANDVNIGRNGRLRFTGGGVYVRSRTLNGPSLVAEALATPASNYIRGLARETREG